MAINDGTHKIWIHFEKSAVTDDSAHKHSGYESESVVVICKHTGKLSAAVSMNKINKNAV